jgi:phosphotransferase system enzyme I (PtsI)
MIETPAAALMSHQLAILKLIEMAAENAHKKGKWIGICGELAADLSMTETFLKMGIDELSVSPGMILELRKKIRDTDTTKS